MASKFIKVSRKL